MQASDGNLYGTNILGGACGGVIIRATLAGDVIPVHDFCGDAPGWDPRSALIQHTNGIIYGDTNQGGTGDSDGVFYSLDAGLPPFVTYLPTYGRRRRAGANPGPGLHRG